MMRFTFACMFLLVTAGQCFCGDTLRPGPNTLQSFSAKVGYYSPSNGLNNGLLIGGDGITEFLHYNFFLSGALDLYLKKSISIFNSPQPDGSSPPDVSDQQILLFPLYANVGYKLLEVADADTRIYAGAGGGYCFYFYSVTYRGSSGGLLGGPLVDQNATKNGGGVLGTVFARILINRIFLEPRYYFVSKTETEVGGYAVTINPSGFAVTLGFQYH